MAGRKKTKRWGMVLGGLSLFGAGAAAAKSGTFAGLGKSLSGLKPAIANVANKWIPNLGGLIGGDRPVGDYLPNQAAVKDALESLYGSTAAGKDAIAQGRASFLGGLLMNPLIWLLGAVGLFFVLRRR